MSVFLEGLGRGYTVAHPHFADYIIESYVIEGDSIAIYGAQYKLREFPYKKLTCIQESNLDPYATLATIGIKSN